MDMAKTTGAFSAKAPKNTKISSHVAVQVKILNPDIQNKTYIY
jgi:hypothetical protein